jgi:hypothetical protein
MKKSLLLISILLYFTGIRGQYPDLYWRFANPVLITEVGACYLQFDTEMSCTDAGTYHCQDDLCLVYSVAVFGESPSVTVSRLELTQGQFAGTNKYLLSDPSGSIPGELCVLIDCSFVIPGSMFLNEVPQYPQFGGMIRFRMQVMNPTGPAGIDFLSSEMDGMCYYVDATHPSPTKYGAPPDYQYTYLNDLLNQSTACQGAFVDLKVFLEGPCNGTTMNTYLNPLLPLNQPFNPPLPYFGNPSPVWQYAGGESVASIPNANVVDWVLIELRDAPDAASATPATAIGRQPCFLMNTGIVTALDGSSMPFFNVSIAQGLFVVIWQRNHLGVMSSVPLVNAGTTYSYDFTSGEGQAYGGANGHKELVPGVWGMTAGDGDGSGQVNNADKVEVWTLQAGMAGYLAGDFNLNSQVDNADKVDYWKPNSGAGSQVPD